MHNSIFPFLKNIFYFQVFFNMTAEKLNIMSYWETKNSYKESKPKWKAEEIWINFDDSELSENNHLIELFGVHVAVEDGREYIYLMTNEILYSLDPSSFQNTPNDKQAMIMQWMLLTKGEKCGFKNCLFSYVMGMNFMYDDVCENTVYTRSCPILLYNGDKKDIREKEKVAFLKELRESLFLYLSGMKRKYFNGALMDEDNNSKGNNSKNESEGDDLETSDDESLDLGSEECSEYESFETEVFDGSTCSDDFDEDFENVEMDETLETERLDRSLYYLKMKKMTEEYKFRSYGLNDFISLDSYKYGYDFQENDISFDSD